MFYSVDILGFKKNGKFSKSWLAATNIKEFKRCVSHGEIDEIRIPSICKDIFAKFQDMSTARLSLWVAAKLTYGTVRIYQLQVIQLYDKVFNLTQQPVISKPIQGKRAKETGNCEKRSKKQKLNLIEKHIFSLNEFENIEDPHIGTDIELILQSNISNMARNADISLKEVNPIMDQISMQVGSFEQLTEQELNDFISVIEPEICRNDDGKQTSIYLEDANKNRVDKSPLKQHQNQKEYENKKNTCETEGIQENQQNLNGQKKAIESYNIINEIEISSTHNSIINIESIRNENLAIYKQKQPKKRKRIIIDREIKILTNNMQQQMNVTSETTYCDVVIVDPMHLSENIYRTPSTVIGRNFKMSYIHKNQLGSMFQRNAKKTITQPVDKSILQDIFGVVDCEIVDSDSIIETPKRRKQTINDTSLSINLTTAPNDLSQQISEQHSNERILPIQPAIIQEDYIIPQLNESCVNECSSVMQSTYETHNSNRLNLRKSLNKPNSLQDENKENDRQQRSDLRLVNMMNLLLELTANHIHPINMNTICRTITDRKYAATSFYTLIELSSVNYNLIKLIKQTGSNEIYHIEIITD